MTLVTASLIKTSINIIFFFNNNIALVVFLNNTLLFQVDVYKYIYINTFSF